MIQDDVMNKETRNENVSCYGGQADKIPFRKRYDHDFFFKKKHRKAISARMEIYKKKIAKYKKIISRVN